MTGPKAKAVLKLELDPSDRVPVSAQIHAAIRRAILTGIVEPGSRLPSGRALAAQLGVARGTVQAAYDRLVDENLVAGAGSAGTVVRAPSRLPAALPPGERDAPLSIFTRPYSSAPLPFQMGVPADDAFPAKTWARIQGRAVRAEAPGHATYADPRGEPKLRAQLAGHLAISRQVECAPDQILITTGYRQGLLLALTVLQAQGRSAWLEEPGYPLARRALELLGLKVVPVPVDEEGLCVHEGMKRARDALVAIVTPGQQAPLGMGLSPARRRALLDWSAGRHAWVLEDDYLGELQLDGRAAPALAAGEGSERVIHLGTFSKTLSPALALGYVVAPRSLVERFVEVAAVLAPAPNRNAQLALAEFIASGHFLRHLRRMKALYRERRADAEVALARVLGRVETAGLALIARMSDATDDVALAQEARRLGINPSALSPWYSRGAKGARGLLLSVTNLRSGELEAACDTLARAIRSRERRARPTEAPR